MGIAGKVGITAAGVPNAGDQANAVVSGTFSAVGVSPAFAFRGPMNLEIYASLVETLNTTAGSLAASVSSGGGSLANGDAINSVNLPAGSTVQALSGNNFTLNIAPRTHYGTIQANGIITGDFPTDRLLGATVTTSDNNESVTLPAGTTVSAIIQANVSATPLAPAVLGIIQLSANPTAVPIMNVRVPFLFQPTGNGITVTGADAAAIFTGAAIDYSATVQLERSFDGGNTWVVGNIGASGTLAQWSTGTPVSLTFGEPEKSVLYRLNCTAYTSGTINYRISQTGGAAESLAIGPLTGG